MRTALVLLALGLAGTPLHADEKCSGEVAAAFLKQQDKPKLRTIMTNPIDTAIVERTLDLVRPDRLHSRVVSSGDKGYVETVVVQKWAWMNSGAGWEEVKPNVAGAMSRDVAEMAAPQKVTANFSCLGKVAYEGKEYLGFRADPGKGDDGVELAATVYVDAASGLPAANVVAPTSGDGAFRFKAHYSYDDGITVEAPVEMPSAAASAPASAPVLAPENAAPEKK